MKICTSPLGEGGPFASASERLLWEHGFVSDYDTVQEAIEAIRQIKAIPQLADLSFAISVASAPTSTILWPGSLAL